MIYKGCIVKLENTYAIVVTDTLEYLKIHKKNNLYIGKEIIFVDEDIYREKKKTLIHTSALAAAILFFIIFSISFLSKQNIFPLKSNEIVAVVSLDINPSIEFEVNRDYEIVKIIPINNEAHDLIHPKWKGRKIQEIIPMVIKKAQQQEYLNQSLQ